jgi:predicted DNA-binding antitoxin AbrB/MazE fold protein
MDPLIPLAFSGIPPRVERRPTPQRVTFGIPLRYSSAMIKTIDATYEDGKLVLEQPLPLPEHTHVRVIIDTDSERAGWLALSEESLREVWDNDADEVFNDLLQK